MDAFTLAASAAAVAGMGAAWWNRHRSRQAQAMVIALEEQLRAQRHAALHDPLTGLPNRRAFDEWGTALVTDPQQLPATAVLIDLDDFKIINDTLGHAVGDQVLVIVARRLAGYGGGRIVARIGGDEFALLLARTSTNGRPDHVDHPSTRELAAVLATPMIVGGHHLRVTASLGIATTTTTTVELSTLMRYADTQMYRSKALRHLPDGGAAMTLHGASRHQAVTAVRHPPVNSPARHGFPTVLDSV
jgi:diguanylate cyclase (GGDEF)-like protein